jgi:hypothetical protein
LKDEKVELTKIWERVKDSSEILSLKKEELLRILNDHKRIRREAEVIKSSSENREELFDQQKQELEKQHTIRLEYLREQNKRKVEMLRKIKEKEIADKQQELEAATSRLNELGVQEDHFLRKARDVEQEKFRILELTQNKQKKEVEIESLEQRLQAMMSSLREKVGGSLILGVIAESVQRSEPQHEQTESRADLSPKQENESDVHQSQP